MRFERQNHQEWPTKPESAHCNTIFQQPARQPRPENFPARTELAYADGPFNPQDRSALPFPAPQWTVLCI